MFRAQWIYFLFATHNFSRFLPSNFTFLWKCKHYRRTNSFPLSLILQFKCILHHSSKIGNINLSLMSIATNTTYPEVRKRTYTLFNSIALLNFLLFPRTCIGNLLISYYKINSSTAFKLHGSNVICSHPQQNLKSTIIGEFLNCTNLPSIFLLLVIRSCFSLFLPSEAQAPS